MNKLEHPYDDLTGGKWLRGNLHAHTTASDGKAELQEVIDEYARRGYDFLMISDHDIFSGVERYATTDTRGMVLIPGNEVSRNGPHMLHVNATKRIEPSPLRQQAINDAIADGGFVVLNHPNWQAKFDHCPIECMRQWIGYVGMEIHNGVIGRLKGSPYATNKWDILLEEGRRIWGFANDDFHLPWGDIELSWNMVYTADRSVQGIVDAMAAGRFYASNGVEITKIEVNGLKIRVETTNARRINAIGRAGTRFATADDKAIEVDAAEFGTCYLRFECWGDGERFAWTQPFYESAKDEV